MCKLSAILRITTGTAKNHHYPQYFKLMVTVVMYAEKQQLSG